MGLEERDWQWGAQQSAMQGLAQAVIAERSDEIGLLSRARSGKAKQRAQGHAKPGRGQYKAKK